jgi:glucokinase
MLLAGDVGGTKTRLAVFETDLRAPLAEGVLPSTDYPGLLELVQSFLARVDLSVERASFGIPGPVLERRSQATNLPWLVDADQLEEQLGLSSVCLLNDLEAVGLAVPLLTDDDLHTLSDGIPVHGGTMAIVAPGTGLGEAFLTWDGERYRAHPSEGSHVDFAPTNSFERGLLDYLLERYERVSYDRVCSGLGLPNIYRYIKESGRAEEPAWLAEKLATADDHTPVIIDTALDEGRDCTICTMALEAFISILGAEAGNLALKVLASGGVYLGGGIPPRVIPALEKGFMRSFAAKGRLSPVVERMPVHVILEPRAAVMGAARYGLES